MSRLRPLVLLSLFTTLTSAHLALAEYGGKVWIEARQLRLPALESQAEGAVVGALKAPDPQGRGLLVVGQDSLPEIYLTPWEGPASRVEALRLPRGDFGRPLWIKPWSEGIAIFYRGEDIRLYDRNFQTVARIYSRFNCIFDVEQTAHAFFCIGPPIVPPPEAQAAWDDPSWRRRFARMDCNLFKVNHDDPTKQQAPLVCDPRLETPTGRILQGGDLISSLDGSRLFLGLEALPKLFILSPEGEILHEVSILEDGESPPELTAEDELYQYQGGKEAAEVRRKVPWFQGLVRWPEAVGMVFQTWDGTQPQFHLDLFGPQGEKLANDLPLDLGPLGANSFIKPLNLPDGRALLAVNDRVSGPEILAQRLYELHLVRPGQQANRLQFLFEGAPAPEVRIAYRVEDPSASARDRQELVHRHTDSNGRLALPAMAAGETLRLAVRDPRFAYFQGLLPAGPHTIELSAGRTLRGIVRDAEKRPLAGVTVQALLPVEKEPGRRGRLSIETDGEGRFELAGLPAIRCFTSWTHPAFATHRRWVDLNRDGELEITLDAGRTVPVQVKNSAGPLQDATLREPESGEIWSTDAEGRATLQGLPAGTPLSLEIEAQDHLPRKIQLPRHDEEIQVSLERGGQLRFRVLDGSGGTPLERLSLSWRQDRVNHRSEVQGIEGYFRLGGLGTGPIELRIEAEGYRPTHLELRSGEGTQDLGTLLLDPGVVIEGRLWDLNRDRSLAGALVTLPRRSPQGSLAARHFQHVQTTRTDDQGLFRLRGLPTGSVCAEIQHADLPPTPLPIQDLETSELRDLGLLLLSEGHRVRGRVVDAAGQGLSSQRVELRSLDLYNPCLRLETQSDDTGDFAFPAVAPGRYFAAVRGKQRLLAARSIEIDDRDRDIGEIRIHSRRFAGRVSINDTTTEGTLTFEASGTGVADFRPIPVFVSYRGPGTHGDQRLINDLGTRFGTAVEADGTYETQQVFPAREALITYRPKGSPAELLHRARIPADGESPLDLDFQGAPITGQVLDEERNPLAGVALELFANNQVIRRTVSDAAGHFLLPAVPAHAVELRGALGGLQGTLNLAEDRPHTLELLLTPETERRLVARMLDGGELPASQGLAFLTDGESLASIRPVDSSGAVQFTGLSAGLYKLVLFCGSGLVEGPTFDFHTTREHETSLTCDEPLAGTVDLGIDRAGQAVTLLTSDGYPLAPLLGYLGRALISDLEGRLELPPLAPGSWLLDPLDGSAPEHLTLRPDEPVIELR